VLRARWLARFILNEAPATGSALARLQRSSPPYAGSRFSIAVPEQIFGWLRPCRDTGVEGRPIWEGRRLLAAGTGKRRLGRRWLAENERKTESHSRAQLIDGPSINQRAAERWVAILAACRSANAGSAPLLRISRVPDIPTFDEIRFLKDLDTLRPWLSNLLVSHITHAPADNCRFHKIIHPRAPPSVQGPTLRTEAFLMEAEATARAAEALKGTAGAGARLKRLAAFLTGWQVGVDRGHHAHPRQRVAGSALSSPPDPRTRWPR
jgi:hypothetical protein